MSKRPNVSQNLALKDAAAARNYDDDAPSGRSYDDETPATPSGDDIAPPRTPENPEAMPEQRAAPVGTNDGVDRPGHEKRWSEEDPAPAPTPATRGRPKGKKREVEAKQTVYLDKARHDALVLLAEANGRSIHSLILEGIDHVTGRPPPQSYKPSI